MTANRVSYTLDSTLESVNKAEETASQVAASLGFPDDDRFKIAIAVREAAVNAVLHGNAYDPKKKVRLAYEDRGDRLIITISDEGAGIHPDRIPDPLAPENLLKTSGRGIFLMRSFMDDVQFRTLQPGTEIIMTKRVHGRAADAKENAQ